MNEWDKKLKIIVEVLLNYERISSYKFIKKLKGKGVTAKDFWKLKPILDSNNLAEIKGKEGREFEEIICYVDKCYDFLSKLEDKEFKENQKIINKSLEKINRKHLGAIIILGIITIILTTVIGFSQYNLNENTNQILENTEMSKLPEILVIPNQGYRFFSLSHLIDKGEGWFQIGITNLGKSTAPFFSVTFQHEDWLSGTVDPQDFNDFESLDYKTAWVKFSLHQIDLSKFETGKKEVEFEIDCPSCRNPKEYQTVEICIYDKTMNEC